MLVKKMKRYEDMTTEEALDKLSSQDLIKYIIFTHLDLMHLTYEPILGDKAKSTVASRELDITDPIQRETKKEWLSKE